MAMLARGAVCVIDFEFNWDRLLLPLEFVELVLHGRTRFSVVDQRLVPFRANSHKATESHSCGEASNGQSQGSFEWAIWRSLNRKYPRGREFRYIRIVLEAGNFGSKMRRLGTFT